MKNFPYFLLAAIIYTLSGGCANEGAAIRVETYNGEDLYICDYSKLGNDTISLKLSDLVSSLEVIKLDTASNALITGGKVILSENYLLLGPDWQGIYKLFGRKGNFLCDVGTYGRGPEEYMQIADAQLDEGNNRIYLLPYEARKLLVYNLQGKFVNSVPLAVFLTGCRMKVENDKVSLLTTPLNVPIVAYQQDMKGNLLDSVSARPYAVNRGMMGDINFSFNREFLSFHTGHWEEEETKQDSLYHYIPGKNRLTPKFTVNYEGMKTIPQHIYYEFGDYFRFNIYRVKTVYKETGIYSSRIQEKCILVDKKNRKAGIFKMKDDLLGEISWGDFSDGYYTENLGPAVLKAKLENLNKKEGLSGETRKRMDDLLNTIQENDNNYIVIGKMK